MLARQTNHASNGSAVGRPQNNSTVLGAVKIVLKTDGDVQKALEHGLFIDMIFYSASLFIQKKTNHTMLQVPEIRTCERKLQIKTKCGH